MFYPKSQKRKRYLNQKIKGLKLKFVSYVLNKLRITSWTRKFNIEGKSFYFEVDNLDLGLSRQLYFTDYREFDSTIYFTKYLEEKKPKQILECGANIGYFACLEKVFSPNSKVIAVEPIPSNFQLLCRNLSLNNFENIETINAAFSDKEGTGIIYDFELKNWATMDESHALKMKKLGYKYDEIEIGLINLDSFIIDKGVDLIRMDIEGFEYNILMNSKQLKNTKCDIFLEFHSNLLGKTKTLDLLKKLENDGYNDCYVVFNNPHCKNDEFFKYNGHHFKTDILKLQQDISNVSLEEVKFQEGFELFLIK